MLRRFLVEDLKKISTLRGIFSFDESGLRLYKNHYMDRPEPEEEYEDERLRGYASRKDVHTLKLAMVLSLADKDDLIITERDMAGAIDAIKWLDQGLPNVFASHGSSASVEDAVRIFRQIESGTRRSGSIRHKELIKRNYYYLNAPEFEIVIRTLLEAEAIEEKVARDSVSGKVEKFYIAIDANFLTKVKSVTPKKLTEE